jgi:hypothetical protein
MSTNKPPYDMIIGVRRALTADITIYVRTDGSDANDGLSNTAGGAKLTIQAAVNLAQSLDANGYNVTIQVAAGAYNAAVSIVNGVVGLGSTGVFTIQGDNTTPGNVTITLAGNNCFLVTNAAVSISGFKMSTTGSGWGIFAQSNAFVRIPNKVEFGACASGCLVATAGAIINVAASFTVSGNCGIVYYGTQRGSVVHSTTSTVTLSGTPAWATAMAASDTLSYVLVANTAVTMSGAATGKRYLVGASSVLTTFGGGANYFPGNVAGTVSGDGAYD